MDGLDKNDNPHIIREEDLESDVHYGGNGINGNNNNKNSYGNIDENLNSDKDRDSDIYNSDYAANKGFSNKDFLKFFRIPIIIMAFLIAAFLAVKFIFLGASNKKIKESRAQSAKPIHNLTINDGKKFSPSVFNYINKKNNTNGSPDAEKIGSRAKFKIKFHKEMKGFKKVKLNEQSDNSSAASPDNSVKIPSKMVVFLKASYAKTILNRENGMMSAGMKIKDKKSRVRHRLFKARAGNVVIPEGTVMNAYVKYEIFSYNTEVPVIAVLPDSYLYRGKVILEKGDKFFGTVSVKHSLGRLNIKFNKIIKINGHSININAIAVMTDGSGGVKGVVHHHYAGNILASLAQGVAGAASMLAGGGSAMSSANPYTFQNQVRDNVAQNELNQAQNGVNQYAESSGNVSITLPKDTPIKIMFLKQTYM